MQVVPTPDDCMDFTVGTYNILAQNLLDEHLYLYRHCEPSQLFWNFRKLNILDEIGRKFPDVSAMIIYISIVFLPQIFIYPTFFIK